MKGAGLQGTHVQATARITPSDAAGAALPPLQTRIQAQAMASATGRAAAAAADPGALVHTLYE